MTKTNELVKKKGASDYAINYLIAEI